MMIRECHKRPNKNGTGGIEEGDEEQNCIKNGVRICQNLFTQLIWLNFIPF